MPGLREQIETAWKTLQPYDEWRSLLPNFPLLSTNTVFYGILWQVILHYPHCKDGCNGRCHARVADLVKHRLECIARGMPDLHPDEESAIWEIAFRIHKEVCTVAGTSPGSIKPLWTDPKDGLSGCCNCFEVARSQYNLLVVREARSQYNLLVVREEDVWYDEQRME